MSKPSEGLLSPRDFPYCEIDWMLRDTGKGLELLRGLGNHPPSSRNLGY